MKSGLWVLSVLMLGVPLTVWHHASSPAVNAGSAIEASTPIQAHRYLGAGSCAAAACHNSGPAPGDARDEYAHWITRDRHAKAYEVLFEDRSVRIQRNRHASVKAHQDHRCLQCHVAPDYEQSDAPYFKNDGVSCESCHGPAKQWVAEHFQSSWKAKSTPEKLQLGMKDTQSLLGRVQLCAGGCHVGVPGMEVDHDLIAAGHPRLNFEFAAFNAAMPHHWPDAKDRSPSADPNRGGPDFEARAWVVGQLMTAKASLELLADRADEHSKVWPEFAEYDCAACHHDLKSISTRQSKDYYGKPQARRLPWGNYVTPLKDVKTSTNPEIMKHLQAIHATMDAGKPNRQTIVTNARAAAKLFAPGEMRPLEAKAIEALMEALLAADSQKASGDEDRPTQIRLGLAALSLARTEMHVVLPAGLHDRVRALAGQTELPHAYDPEAMQKRLIAFKYVGPKKER